MASGKHQAVGIFTAKTLQEIANEGGTGWWKALQWKVEERQWVVLFRNHSDVFAPDDVPHGAIFAIGKISGSRADWHSRRIIIEISQICQYEGGHKQWPGFRNPVSYDISLEEMGINPDELEFLPLEEFRDSAAEASIRDEVQDHNVIEEAKKMISQEWGIPVDKITIDINGL